MDTRNHAAPTSRLPANPTSNPGTPAPTQGKLLATFRGHPDGVRAVAFTADRCLLTSLGREGCAAVWDVGSSKPGERAVIRKSESFRSLAFSPANRLLAVGAAFEVGLVWLFDLSDKTPQEKATLRGARGAVEALAFSPDGKLVAGGGEDLTLRIWEPSANPRGEPRTLLLGHTKPIVALAFAPDGQSVATAAQDSTVRTWTLSRIRSSQRALLPHPAEVTSVAYTPDGKTLATACKDGVIRLWDLTAINPTVKAELKGHPGGAKLLLVPDYEQLVSAGEAPRVRNWDHRTGKLIREWELAAEPCSALALTPDGRYLARGAASGGIEVHRVAEKRA